MLQLLLHGDKPWVNEGPRRVNIQSCKVANESPIVALWQSQNSNIGEDQLHELTVQQEILLLFTNQP